TRGLTANGCSGYLRSRTSVRADRPSLPPRSGRRVTPPQETVPMAAVLTPQHHPGRAQLSTRPQLRALDGGRSEMAARYRRRRIVAGVIALLAVAATWNAVSAVWPTSDSAQQV